VGSGRGRCGQSDEVICWAYNGLRTSTPSGVVGGFEVVVAVGLGWRVGNGVIDAPVLCGAVVIAGALLVRAVLCAALVCADRLCAALVCGTAVDGARLVGGMVAGSELTADR